MLENICEIHGIEMEWDGYYWWCQQCEADLEAEWEDIDYD